MAVRRPAIAQRESLTVSGFRAVKPASRGRPVTETYCPDWPLSRGSKKKDGLLAAVSPKSYQLFWFRQLRAQKCFSSPRDNQRSRGRGSQRSASSMLRAAEAGVWFRRVVCSRSLLIRGPQRARHQAETPLIVLCRFPGPALVSSNLSSALRIMVTQRAAQPRPRGKQISSP
jgi:hypothetical protein